MIIKNLFKIQEHTQINLPKIIVLFLFLGSMFLSVGTLIESTILTKWYVLISGGIICALFLFFVQNSHIRFDNLSWLFCAFVLFILIRGVLSEIQPIKILMFSATLILFFFFRTNVVKQKQINNVIVIVCVLQASYGILQYIDVISTNSSFGMVGSFDNPAGIAACLSIGYPFCFTLKRNFKYLSFASITIIVLAIIFSGSRTGMIAVFLTSGIYLYNRFKYKITNRRLFFIIIFSLILAIGIALFLYKKNSAIGRLMIWQNTTQMIVDKPLFGHGSGSFMSQYMPYQATYFSNHPNSNFALLADNVTHPFNEYLLLMAEYGVIVFILLFGIIILIVKSTKISAYTLALLSVAIFACFSYPLRYGFVIIVLTYALSCIHISKITSIRLNFFSKLVLFILSLICTIFLIKDIAFEYRWGKLAQGIELKPFDEVLSEYQKLDSHWNGNVFFRCNYATTLFQAEHYEESLRIAFDCKKKCDDYDVQMMIANNFMEINNYTSAEKHYLIAKNMCPNRFMPLYCLMTLYMESSEPNKAMEIAKQITLKKVKIYSPVVNSIIKNAYKYINNIPVSTRTVEDS